MSSTRILLVEDEENFGSVLTQFLKLSGFDVTWAKHGKEAYSIIHADSEFDCCILDVMMPEMDGITLGQELRKLRSDLPFIYLTAKGMKEDMVEGYEAGADDYITKPFDSEVLVLKLKALLKRKPDVKEQTFQLADAEYNVSERLITLSGGEEIRLSPKENGILEALIRSKGTMVSREEIMGRLWDEDNYFNRRSMDVYMSKLRKYLKPLSSVEIISLHAGGYKLIET